MFNNRINKNDIKLSEDLKNRNLTVEFRSELGIFSDNVNKAIKDFRTNIADYSYLSQNLINNNKQLLQVFNDSFDDFKEMDSKMKIFKDDITTYSKELSEVHEYFDDYSKMSGESKNNIKKIQDNMVLIQESIRNSMQIFSDMVALINDTNIIMSEISSDMKSLGSDMDGINFIVENVRKISSQTSLLSLNASIDIAVVM